MRKDHLLNNSYWKKKKEKGYSNEKNETRLQSYSTIKLTGNGLKISM